MNGPETHWHEQYVDTVGNHPVALAMWRPITPARAVFLLSRGLLDRVALGDPRINRMEARFGQTGGGVH